MRKAADPPQAMKPLRSPNGDWNNPPKKKEHRCMRSARTIGHGWRCVLATASLLAAAALQADDAPAPQFMPAHFGTGPDSLLAVLECPSVDIDQSVFVYCQAAINETGEVG